MKKKISNILGVGLALVLAFSMAGAFLPANEVEAQAYTPNMWNTMSIPSFAGGVIRANADVTDLAVASDGATIYAVDAAGDAIVLLTTTAFAGAAPGDNVTVTVGFTNQAGVAGVTLAAVIPGGSAAGTVIPLALVAPATGVLDVTPLVGCVIVEASVTSAGTFSVLGVDTNTVYATGSAVAGAAGPTWTDGAVYQGVLKSTTAGHSFSAVLSPTVAAGFVAPARLVAVAPDDPNVIVIVDSGDKVWLSTSGGAIWSNMGAPAPGADDITDIAISPARATAVMGRDIVVCTADPAPFAPLPPAVPVTGFGNIYLIGQTTNWAPVGVASPLAPQFYDYTSVAFEPNWVGGRSIVAVGSSGSVAVPPPAGGTYLHVIRTTTPVTPVMFPTRIQPTGITDPDEIGSPTGNGMLSSSLALPSDFDSTSPPMIQAYIGWTSGSGFDDVYRVDYNFARKLGIAANVGIQSIDFCGTRAEGTLVAGETAIVYGVWTSTNPQTALPTWSFTYKGPTGATNMLAAMAPDYGTSKTIYAGTSGTESGFSMSANGGLSFNQLSLIDTAIAGLDDVMPAPGGSTLFLATNNGVNNSSLWRSEVTPPSIGTWQRVRLRGTVAVPLVGYIIRLSPEYADDNTLYYCDVGIGGRDIQKSTNSGDIFAPRTAGVDITDVVVENATTLYMASANNVFKSTNGAWFFGLGIDARVGTVYSLAMAPTYPDKPVAGNVLVGGGRGGYVSLSTDGGASFAPLLAAIPGGTNMQVVADKGYADNNLVYAGSAAVAAPGIFRYEVGVSRAWERISGAPTTGLAMHCGVLYGAFATGAARSLWPSLPVIAAGTFQVMNVGAGAAAFNSVPSALRVTGDDTEVWLWAIDTTAPGTLMAYNDTMAKVAPELSVPAEVAADPATGGNAQFTITWTKVSNAIAYALEIHSDAGCTKRVTTAPLNYGAAVGPPAVLAWAYTPSLALAPAWVVPAGTLPSGATYYVRVGARDQMSFDAIMSPWSTVESFTVASGVPITAPHGGPQLLGPAGGATDVSLRPGFSWAPVLGATEYEFVLATDAALTSTVAGPAKVKQPSYELAADLSYSTTYFWGARVTKPAAGPQGVGTFTTMAKAVPPVTVTETPAPIVEIPAPIPNWMLVTIIVIGAVLGIAVIVLIVRTRRVV